MRQSSDSLYFACMTLASLVDVCHKVIELKLFKLLQPTPLHLTVKEYVTPEKFAFWKEYGESIGFRYVASGPLVRSLCC